MPWTFLDLIIVLEGDLDQVQSLIVMNLDASDFSFYPGKMIRMKMLQPKRWKYQNLLMEGVGHIAKETMLRTHDSDSSGE